jgi:hypothetical protein
MGSFGTLTSVTIHFLKEYAMKKYLLFGNICSLLLLVSCDFSSLLEETSDSVNPGLSENQLVAGLKESLVLGSRTAAFTLSDTSGKINTLNEVTGYLANEAIRIALPADVEKAFTTVSLLTNTAAGKTLLAAAGIDLSNYREAMIKGLNRGAENAAGVSIDVFKTAITAMTITSAKEVLFGADSIGATNYLQTTTSSILISGFKPIVDSSFSAVKVDAFGTQYTIKGIWKEFSLKYNKVAETYQGLKSTAASTDLIASSAAKLSLSALVTAGVPSVDSLNTDIIGYTTDKAMVGLFYMVGKQEIKIRRDPVAALSSVADFVTETISDLIKKVFTSS